MNIDLEIVDAFERRFGEPAAHSAAQRFMLAYFSLMNTPLPEVVARGLDVARQFLSGSAAREKLIEARVNCWKYLKENNATYDLTKPECSVTRAAICLLDDRTGNGGDTVDLIDFFLHAAAKFESHPASVDPLLRRFFSSP
jgi:hypothetical protein